MHHIFGIKNVANQLLESYLSSRKQYTKVHNHKSKMAKITYGIPSDGIQNFKNRFSSELY